jgi:hypothetical protein
MRRVGFIAMLAAIATAAIGDGWRLREENDYFTGSDRNYTQGMEILLLRERSPVRHVSYGIRNLMYSPSNLATDYDVRTERPWYGMTCAVIGSYEIEGWTSLRREAIVGVSGLASQSDHIQRGFHRLIGSDRPSWEPINSDDLVANILIERQDNVLDAGDLYRIDANAICAVALGTAFTHVECGMLVRAGRNMARHHSGSIINPTARREQLFAYLFAEGRARAVIHNAALDGSMWESGYSRDTEFLVGDLMLGASVGLRNPIGTLDLASLSVAVVGRSREFDGQDDSSRFASITLHVGKGW